MDYNRSSSIQRARLYRDSDHISLIRWYPAAPGAKVFPGWHAFGHPAWEDAQGRDEFIGPGAFLAGQEWVGNRYPAPPGQHFHGPIEWFRDGIPLEELREEFPVSTCGGPIAYGDGGIEVGGASPVASASITACSVCTRGAFQRYLIRVRGVQDGTRSASEVNGDFVVTWTTACIWQGPRFLQIGAQQYFWQYGIGGIQKRTQLRRVSPPASVVIYDNVDPYNCFDPISQTLTSANVFWDWSAATVQVFPFAE